MSRTWTQDEIKNLVQTNDRVLYGALRQLYACQTADEIAEGAANHRNGAGFNGIMPRYLQVFASSSIEQDF